MFHRPHPRNSGYVLFIAAGAAVAVAGAFLPVYIEWPWVNTAGHAAGGVALVLGLWILLDRIRALSGVVFFSIVWEIIKWSVGVPFYVMPSDTVLDLAASWAAAFGGVIVFSLTIDKNEVFLLEQPQERRQRWGSCPFTGWLLDVYLIAAMIWAGVSFGWFLGGRSAVGIPIIGYVWLVIAGCGIILMIGMIVSQSSHEVTFSSQ